MLCAVRMDAIWMAQAEAVNLEEQAMQLERDNLPVAATAMLQRAKSKRNTADVLLQQHVDSGKPPIPSMLDLQIQKVLSALG